MKKFFCVFCSLVVMIMCLGGCSGSSSNPFTADDAKKGQIGDLYYVVPNDAVSDNNTDNGTITISYRVPIENSVEEYALNFIYTYVSQEDAESEEEVLEYVEALIEFIEETQDKSGIPYVSEDIDEFAGVTVDRGIKVSKEENDQKSIIIIAVKSRKVYTVGYSAKTGFFDQSVWDNFYNQLKIIESD